MWGFHHLQSVTSSKVSENPKKSERLKTNTEWPWPSTPLWGIRQWRHRTVHRSKRIWKDLHIIAFCFYLRFTRVPSFVELGLHLEEKKIVEILYYIKYAWKAVVAVNTIQSNTTTPPLKYSQKLSISSKRKESNTQLLYLGYFSGHSEYSNRNKKHIFFLIKASSLRSASKQHAR